MYAIIQSGGKQYRVEPNTRLSVDRLSLEPGAAFESKQVVLVSNDDNVQVGAPFVEGVTVKGTVVGHTKGKKLIIFKRKRRKGYRRKYGHRQQYTEVKIEAIEA